MTDVERAYHEAWMGMVQPVEGLVFAIPVLTDAQVMERHGPEFHDAFLKHLVEVEREHRVADLEAFLHDVLQFKDTDFLRGAEMPDDLTLWVPEGRQKLAPTLVLRREDAKAGAPGHERAEMLIWSLPAGMDPDKAEKITGTWEYPPTAKFDRMLRGTRVPVGLLFNGEQFRLVFAPHGESSGSVTFRVEDMASVGGRPIFEAFVSLLGRHRFFNVAAERTLRSLFVESRTRQAGVTNQLAEQVFEAVNLLLQGFAGAEERDGTGSLRDALEADDKGDHVYGGLLTSMLRLVFLLYAEDRGLMPMDQELYSEHLSVLGLFDSLQEDAGAFPDTMGRRFGAWGRLLALFRAIYEGADHDAFHMPARRGALFDPNTYPFLEGWERGGSAPKDVDSRGKVRVPSVDDETSYNILERLLVLNGQRLSYRALDVEQIGSVYEALMGYHVLRLTAPSVCVKGSKAWLQADELLAQKPAQREAWVVEQSALPKGQVTKVAAALKAATSTEDVLAALEPLRVKDVPVRPAGALVIQPGSERRRTSSHYTPRSLSAPIVEKTLAPLLRVMGDAPSSARLLELKVCDPAMGSGAFLVESCRYLADEVVKAWTREGAIHDIEAQHGEALIHARRLVAQRCLYGIDKNPFAVTLAKLSLWLVSLARNEPFSFVDHSLRHGDSLVGLSVEQVRAFHWDLANHKDRDWTAEAVTRDLEEALVHRQRILTLAREHGTAPAKEKEQLLRDAEDAVRNARLIGDLVVGAFFSADKDKEREKDVSRRLSLVEAWHGTQEPPPGELTEMQEAMRAITPVFHWPIEFPEIFYKERPDPLDADSKVQSAWMDAFVGNPPFIGKNGISEMGGDRYLPWLQVLHTGAHGNADYSAHFFRRCADLLGAHGTLGLIATNTIAQGDTRATGLQALVNAGAVIYDAQRSMMWPGDAAVAVSVVHVAKGVAAQHTGRLVLDGAPTASINSRLRPKPERPDPRPLSANEGLSYQGCIVLGMGFVLSPEAREALVKKNKANAQRIFPYIGGEEVNSSPTQAFNRYVINFGEMTLEEAERWPDLIKIVREKVKPERDQNKRENYRERWWQFGEARPGLLALLKGRGHCIVTAAISKHLMFSRQPTGQVFSHKLFVIVRDEDWVLGALQSRVHAAWARLLSSTLEERLNYTPSDCLDTFSFPRERLEGLSAIAQRLQAARAADMASRSIGLTQKYNALTDRTQRDPDIVSLRGLHEDLDRAVLDSYGWSDIVVPPYCPRDAAEQRAVAEFEEEVIDRLFALNAERAKEEALLGNAAEPAPKPAKPATKPAKKLKGGSKNESFDF